MLWVRHCRLLMLIPYIFASVIFFIFTTVRVVAFHDPGDSINTASASSPPVCWRINNATSSATSVFYPIDLLGEYGADITHWARSSTQMSECSVRPGSPADLSIILKIIGETRTPFAVKGGGHTTNPGFSSTTGVHISMKQFSQVTYDAATRTAVVGAGLVWDDVYAALAPYNVTVVGGRVTGVGVAGFTLGGGYSWLTNQYGLTIDNVVAYELVKPTGEIVTVTETSDPELFFGLKGGLNNFGIVTRFTLRTFPQGLVWGGLITFTSSHIPKVTDATAAFSASVTDPKAAAIIAYNFLLGQPGVSLLLFYDGATPPSRIFDEFLAIPHFTKDISTRDFLSLVKSAPSDITYGQRGIFNSVSLTRYTPTLLKAILNETEFWGSRLSLTSGLFFSYDVEPFLPTLFTHSAESSSAYPPSRKLPLYPLNIYFAWAFELADEVMHDAVRRSAAHIRAVAISEGQDVGGPSVYPNYAIYDTPLERMYGGNMGRLRKVKARVDPGGVMGLAGGFRL